MRIEALIPLRVRLNGRELLLDPGVQYQFSEDEARRLLERAKGKVRLVESDEAITLEPAVKPDGSPLSPIYWERATGIVGPAVPEFMVKVGEAFWIVAQFEGLPVW